MQDCYTLERPLVQLMVERHLKKGLSGVLGLLAKRPDSGWVYI